MIVIADTTPLNYLVLINQADILHHLYGRVLIPEAVRDEMQRKQTPNVVRDWIAAPPPWLEIRGIARPVDSSLGGLDAGEQQAIALAQEVGANVLVLDDKDARREAVRRQFTVIGTLGVLEEGAKLSLLDLPMAIEALRHTTFRADEELLIWFLHRDAERKRTRQSQ